MKRYFKIYNIAIILGSMSLIMSSCSDKDKVDNIHSVKGNVSIRSIRFVNDDKITNINGGVDNNVTEKLASSKKANGSNETIVDDSFGSTQITPYALQSGTDFDFSTDIESNAIEQKESGLKASTKGSALKAADVPLNSDKKFRLIFIKDGSNSPIYNEVLSAGEDPNLTVASNTKYKWYAISINDGSTAPDIDGSGNISGSDLDNKDFMFASGELTTQEDENYLDILFLRQMAAVEVKLNTRGLFGVINDNSTITVGRGSGSSFTNLIQTGDFSIFDGTFSNLQDAQPLNGAQMTVVDNRWGNAEKIGQFFTANTGTTIEANNLRVRLNSLEIKLDDNTTRTFASNSLVPISHSAALTLTKGTLSKTNVRLIESGVTVGNLVWARTNLVYDVNKLYGGSYSAGNSDAYRFRTNNNYAFPNKNTEYWNFGTKTPTGTDYVTTDPCRRVYPEGTWRYPQELNNPKEMTQLTQNNNNSTSRTQVSDGYRYSVTYTSSSASNPAYPDNNLLLSFYGYRDGNGNIQQIPSGSANGSGTIRYRSNAYNTSNNYNHIFYAELNNGSYSSASIQQTAPGLGTVTRCVRNIVNN